MFFAALLTSTIALAQVPPDLSNTELGKESENPVSRFIVLPFRYEGDLYYGAFNETQSTVDLDQDLDGYYNVVRPQGIGPIWELQITLTLIFR